MVKNMEGSHDTWPAAASMSYFQACPSAVRTGHHSGALILEVPISSHVCGANTGAKVPWPIFCMHIDSLGLVEALEASCRAAPMKDSLPRSSR